MSAADSMKRIGLIAGSGQFPLIFSKAASAKGYQVYAVGYVNEADPTLVETVAALEWLHLGQLKRLVRFFRQNGVCEAVMMGAVRKTRMFTDIRPDTQAIALAARMRHTHDDNLLRAFAAFLEKEGVRIQPSTFLLPELLAPEGCWTRRRPTRSEEKDIALGWRLAKEVGRLDIGQCIVVGGGSVLAVEAIDGTDATILRGGQLGKGTAVVVKVCKPNQDFRFDVPAIGAETVRNMQAAGARVLVVEAGKAVVFDRGEMVALADRHGIAIGCAWGLSGLAILANSTQKNTPACLMWNWSLSWIRICGGPAMWPSASAPRPLAATGTCVDLLIEKPMTSTLRQADELIDFAESHGLLIQVGHLERFNSAVAALRNIVTAPMFIESHRLATFKGRGTDVSVVLDLMIHDIDIISNFVRSEIRAIRAAGIPVISHEVDIANARLEFENGCVANVTASRISIKNERKIRLFQRDAYVSVDFSNHHITVIRKTGEHPEGIIPGMEIQELCFTKGDALDDELKSFVRAVKRREVPEVTGQMGRDALRIALDIMDQIQSTNSRYFN